MSLYNFLELAMDDYYKINVFYTNTGEEILHQVEVGEIREKLENEEMVDLLYNDVVSWDINEENNNEFTINIE